MKRRILVLQMCRLGDILQTTPMLRGLRREAPGAEITLVLHDVFKGVPVPSRLSDRLITFPYTTLAHALSVSSSNWRAQLDTLRGFLADLGPEPFDVVLNLTHSDLSGFLAACIPSRRVEGALIAPDRTRVVQGRWMSYFWASQTSRAQGCFNLVDLHNWVAGVASDGRPLEIDIAETARDRVRDLMASRGLGERRILAVQLGASEERKRWHPERFAATMNRLPADSLDVVFVGTSDERPLFARAAAQLERPVHDLLGQTKLAELPALLQRCAALLTNDTGTMHVATAAGTRVIDLSAGPVFVHETAPYGEGHYVMEPDIECFPCTAGASCHHYACREKFEPADVAALVRHVLGDGPLPAPASARIMTGTFQPNGRIEYRSLWPGTPSRAEVLRHASAEMWMTSLAAPSIADSRSGNASRADRRRGRASLDFARDGSVLPSARGSLDSSEDFSAVHDALARFAARAEAVAAAARQVPRAGGTRQARLSADIQAGVAELRLIGELEPVCQPLAAFLSMTLDSTFTRDVPAIAATYARECADAATRARRLGELLPRPQNVQAARAIEKCRRQKGGRQNQAEGRVVEG